MPKVRNDVNCLLSLFEMKFLNRIGTYYFSSDEVSIEESVINSAKQNFAIYDSVTNGALFTRLKMLTVKI